MLNITFFTVKDIITFSKKSEIIESCLLYSFWWCGIIKYYILMSCFIQKAAVSPQNLLLPGWSVCHSVDTCCPSLCRASPGVSSWRWGRRRPSRSSRSGTASRRCAPAGGASGCQTWWRAYRTLRSCTAPRPCAVCGAGWAGWSVCSSFHRSSRSTASEGWEAMRRLILRHKPDRAQ